MIKKTYNINLAGRQFVIDDDAYTLANNYLDAIEHLVKDPEDRDELTSDIEDRMAELLTIKLEESRSTIISLNMVESVIARIGQPNDFIEVDETEFNEQTGRRREDANVDSPEIDIENIKVTTPTGSSVTPTPPYYTSGKQKRRLYRDPENAVFGGVCSGLAHFFNIDPIWIRLLFVLLALGLFNLVSFSWAVFVYILLWIIVPPADTPVKRMEMFGEAPTLGNLAKTMTDAVNNGYDQPIERRGGWKSFVDNFTRVIQTIGKGILLFFGVIGVPMLLAFGIAILGLIFVLICYATGMFGNVNLMEEVGMETIWGIWCGLGVCVTLSIPTFLLVWYLIRCIKPDLHLSRSWEIILAILWVVAFVFTAICCAILGFDIA